MDPLNPAAAQDNTAPATDKAQAVTPGTAQAATPPVATPPAVDPKVQQATAVGEYPSMLASEKPAEAVTDAEAENKEGDGEPAKEFEIKLPEGFVEDPEIMSVVKEQIKSGALKPEAAQTLADQYVEGMKRYEAKRIAQGLEQIDSWQDEIRNSKEFGGVNLDANVEAAKNMLHKYGSPKLVQEFKQMGVLSHPEFAFMLMRMSKDVSEGKSLGGANQTAPETTAAALYPTMK